MAKVDAVDRAGDDIRAAVEQTKDSDPSGAVKLLRESIAASEEAARDIAAAAPPEIRDAANDYVKVMTQDESDTTASAALAATQAARKLSEYRKQHC